MTIIGTGMLDMNYRENVKLMARLSGHDLKELHQTIDSAATLDIQKFLNLRELEDKPFASIARHAATLFSSKEDVVIDVMEAQEQRNLRNSTRYD